MLAALRHGQLVGPGLVVPGAAGTLGTGILAGTDADLSVRRQPGLVSDRRLCSAVGKLWGMAVQLGPSLLALALGSIGFIARMTRSAMMEVLSQDFIRTADAKGLSRQYVVSRHGLPNALIPIVTVVGIIAGGLLGGAVVIEQVFSLPGVGRLLIGAILSRDIPLIQGGLLMVALVLSAGESDRRLHLRAGRSAGSPWLASARAWQRRRDCGERRSGMASPLLRHKSLAIGGVLFLLRGTGRASCSADFTLRSADKRLPRASGAAGYQSLARHRSFRSGPALARDLRDPAVARDRHSGGARQRRGRDGDRRSSRLFPVHGRAADASDGCVDGLSRDSARHRHQRCIGRIDHQHRSSLSASRPYPIPPGSHAPPSWSSANRIMSRPRGLWCEQSCASSCCTSWSMRSHR